MVVLRAWPMSLSRSTIRRLRKRRSSSFMRRIVPPPPPGPPVQTSHPPQPKPSRFERATSSWSCEHRRRSAIVWLLRFSWTARLGRFRRRQFGLHPLCLIDQLVKIAAGLLSLQRATMLIVPRELRVGMVLGQFVRYLAGVGQDVSFIEPKEGVELGRPSPVMCMARLRRAWSSA